MDRPAPSIGDGLTRRPASSNVWLAVLLGVLTAGLLALVAYEAAPRLGYVLVILAGMTAAAALSILQARPNSDAHRPVVQVTFNEVLVAKSIAEGAEQLAIPAPQAQPVRERESGAPWDLDTFELACVDPALALAKLRMDIERELRRIAFVARMEGARGSLAATRIAQELGTRDIIPAPWLAAIQEILSVCSRAVHGLDVPRETADSAIRAGSELVDRLRLVMATPPEDPQTVDPPTR